MKRAAIVLGAVLLAGCLEVNQYPPWRNGAYAGKPDALPDQRYFHGDALAWTAAITNRNWLQDEYRRTLHKGGPS